MSDLGELRTAWQQADAKTREAKERLAAAWAAFAADQGPPPDRTFIEEVDRLRRERDHRLTSLLAALTAALGR